MFAIFLFSLGELFKESFLLYSSFIKKNIKGNLLAQRILPSKYNRAGASLLSEEFFESYFFIPFDPAPAPPLLLFLELRPLFLSIWWLVLLFSEVTN